MTPEELTAEIYRDGFEMMQKQFKELGIETLDPKSSRGLIAQAGISAGMTVTLQVLKKYGIIGS